jgi:hypothetical protein
VVEVLHEKREGGRLFQVLIDVSLPGRQIVLSREAEEDVDVALRNAFDAAQREMVEDWTEQIGVGAGRPRVSRAGPRPRRDSR